MEATSGPVWDCVKLDAEMLCGAKVLYQSAKYEFEIFSNTLSSKEVHPSLTDHFFRRTMESDWSIDILRC